jgi:5-methylcytosine-specific restriction endonuclease McrA
VHEYSSNPDVVERVREGLAWVTKFHRRYVEIRPEDARELIDRCDLLTTALTGLVDMQFSGVIHRSSFEHVRREALWENARAVLAAGTTESETP